MKSLSHFATQNARKWPGRCGIKNKAQSGGLGSHGSQSFVGLQVFLSDTCRKVLNYFHLRKETIDEGFRGINLNLKNLSIVLELFSYSKTAAACSTFFFWISATCQGMAWLPMV